MKMLVDIDLLNIAVRYFVMKGAANLTSFTGSLSEPDAFLGDIVDNN